MAGIPSDNLTKGIKDCGRTVDEQTHHMREHDVSGERVPQTSALPPDIRFVRSVHDTPQSNFAAILDGGIGRGGTALSPSVESTGHMLCGSRENR